MDSSRITITGAEYKLFHSLCTKGGEQFAQSTRTFYAGVVGMWHLEDNQFILLPANKEQASHSLTQHKNRSSKRWMNSSDSEFRNNTSLNLHE